jgi:hypothetical protein
VKYGEGIWRGVVERYVARQAETSGEEDGEEETVGNEMGRVGEGRSGEWGGAGRKLGRGVRRGAETNVEVKMRSGKKGRTTRNEQANGATTKRVGRGN